MAVPLAAPTFRNALFPPLLRDLENSRHVSTLQPSLEHNINYSDAENVAHFRLVFAEAVDFPSFGKAQYNDFVRFSDKSDRYESGVGGMASDTSILRRFVYIIIWR